MAAPDLLDLVVNIWLLLFSTESGEYVAGPFTSLSISPDSVDHTLTGKAILVVTQTRGYDPAWMLSWSSTFFERFVIQSGGAESPWGTRGRRLAIPEGIR